MVVFTVCLVQFNRNKPKRPEPFLLRDNPLLLPDEEFNVCPHILSGLFVLSLLFCQSSQHRISFSCGKNCGFFFLRILKINFDYISTKILDFFFFMCNQEHSASIIYQEFHQSFQNYCEKEHWFLAHFIFSENFNAVSWNVRKQI